MVREPDNSNRCGALRALRGAVRLRTEEADYTGRARPRSGERARRECLVSSTSGTHGPVHGPVPRDQARRVPNRVLRRARDRAHDHGDPPAGSSVAITGRCEPVDHDGFGRARDGGQTRRQIGSPERLTQPIPNTHLPSNGARRPLSTLQADVILSAGPCKASADDHGGLLQIRSKGNSTKLREPGANSNGLLIPSSPRLGDQPGRSDAGAGGDFIVAAGIAGNADGTDEVAI